MNEESNKEIPEKSQSSPIQSKAKEIQITENGLSAFNKKKLERKSKYNFDKQSLQNHDDEIVPLNTLVKKTREENEQEEKAMQANARNPYSTSVNIPPFHINDEKSKGGNVSNINQKVVFIDTERKQREQLEKELALPNPIMKQVEEDKEAVSLTINVENGKQKTFTQINKPAGPWMLHEFLAMYDKLEENDQKAREINNEVIYDKPLDFNVFSNAIIRSELLCFFPENMINPAINPTEDSSPTSQLMQNSNIERLNLLKIPVSKQLLDLLD